jgi:hypothetical protein
MGKQIGVDKLGEPTYANETITPELAQHYHDMYLRNRTIRKIAVGEYAEAMENDGWYLNGEGVTFTWEAAPCDCTPRHGMPANGDHRFLACVKAGVPFRTLVTRGVDPDSFRVIDSTRSRGFRDDLQILGVGWAGQSGGLMRKIAWWNITAARDALARNVPVEKANSTLDGLGSFHASRTELHEMWDQPLPDGTTTYGKSVMETIQACSQWHNDFPGDRGAMLFVHWLLTQEGNNPEVVSRFFSIVTYGSEDRANTVLIKLSRMLAGTDLSRERALKMAGKRQETHAIWLLRNWDRWVSMGKLPSFVVPGDDGLLGKFPTPRRVR